MFGLFSCSVYGRQDVKSGAAVLTSGNRAGALEGSRIVVIVPDKELHLTVDRLASLDDTNQDNITVSSADGVGGAASGQYRLESEFEAGVAKALGTRKVKSSLILMILTIASAAGAAIAASQKDDCSGIGCVKLYTWVLIGISAIAALVSWYRDNIA